MWQFCGGELATRVDGPIHVGCIFKLFERTKQQHSGHDYNQLHWSNQPKKCNLSL